MAGGNPTLGDELMFPSNYLSEPDLKGREFKVKIESVIKDDLMMEGGKKKKSFIIAFVGAQKKLVLNKTNAKAIASIHGGKAEAWVGKEITLYPTTCRFKGDANYPCIRVKGGD